MAKAAMVNRNLKQKKKLTKYGIKDNSLKQLFLISTKALKKKKTLGSNSKNYREILVARGLEIDAV